MDLVEIYQCLCDKTRLRILNLLSETPLCVCHFQDILQEPQVKISKHLAYLRERGMVETERQRNRVIYSLPSKRDAELELNMKCLQDCVQSHPVFKKDLSAAVKLRVCGDQRSDLFSRCRDTKRSVKRKVRSK